MLEAITACEQIAGRPLDWRLEERARVGDHQWWISDLAEFRSDYPLWKPKYHNAQAILTDIYCGMVGRSEGRLNVRS